MLEWLSKILPKEIKLSINFSPKLTINNIKLDSDNTVSQPVIIKKDELIINEATKEGRKIADKVIKQLPSNLSHNDVVLEDGNLENYKAIDKQLSSKDFKRQLDEFRKAVPKSDVPILEVAILIKDEYEAGKNVGQLKSQVVQRFGPRAGMISNLYSAGYFHTVIEPLYSSVADGDMAIDEYLEIYEMFVTESPLAMFVGVGTSRAKAKTMLLKKIAANKSVEVEYLNIHGIGQQNIDLIRELLADEEVNEHFTEEPTVELTDRTIKATVYL